MDCVEAMRTQAYFDGELDALASVEVERHLAHCASCGRLLSDLGSLRAAIQALPRAAASDALARRIHRALALEPSSPRRWGHRRFWAGAASGIAGTAAAASLAFMLLSPPAEDRMQAELTAAHLRSLVPSHLVDVESTDQHTVKPWFAGHSDVSPVVADFASRGFPLIGGRVDYLEGQRAAVLVYRHGAHVINVFSWQAHGGRPRDNATRNGYHLLFWSSADLRYCAVSDAGWPELQALEVLMQGQDSRDRDAGRAVGNADP